FHVTGVQTCALPICLTASDAFRTTGFAAFITGLTSAPPPFDAPGMTAPTVASIATALGSSVALTLPVAIPRSTTPPATEPATAPPAVATSEAPIVAPATAPATAPPAAAPKAPRTVTFSPLTTALAR